LCFCPSLFTPSLHYHDLHSFLFWGSSDFIKLFRMASENIGVKTETKLRGLSPRAKYTDPATIACRRS
jgi:hypothetical protein